MLPYIDIPFEYVSKTLGASLDEVKMIFTFLIAYPLAGVFKRIPDRQPWLKNLFTISVSMFFLLGLFDLWSGLATLLFSSIGSYAIAYFIDGPMMPWVAFIFLMGHMSISHIYRQMVSDPSVVDITGAQMVMVMRLSAFCWNVHDGQLPERDLNEYQKSRAIKQLPDLLNYFGYVFFFPSLHAGPAFDYNDYERFITTTMFDLPPGVDPSKAPPTRKKRRIPRSGRPAMFKMVVGLLWLLGFLQSSGIYYPDYLLSDEYMRRGLLHRIFAMHMVGFVVRMKFYAVWTLTEGACILSGIGYNGVDPVTGKASWDRLQNVKPLGIELAQNTHAYLGNWNINTNNWLRHYMYLRVTPRGKKPGFRASMATFVTSAFWHGFEPGYYMSFVLASFHQFIAKNGRRLLRPFFLNPPAAAANAQAGGKHVEPTPTKYKIYYDLATWLVTQLAFSFTVIPFIMLSSSRSLTVWARVYFYCIFGVIACLGFLFSPAKAHLSRAVRKRNGEDRPGMTRVKSAHSLKSSDDGNILGVPNDPEKELQEIMQEVRDEIEVRRRRGSSVENLDVRKLVEEKWNELTSSRDKVKEKVRVGVADKKIS